VEPPFVVGDVEAPAVAVADAAVVHAEAAAAADAPQAPVPAPSAAVCSPPWVYSAWQWHVGLAAPVHEYFGTGDALKTARAAAAAGGVVAPDAGAAVGAGAPPPAPPGLATRQSHGWRALGHVMSTQNRGASHVRRRCAPLRVPPRASFCAVV
jgi:hypothetical protein